MRLHLWKGSWTTLEETPNHSRCRAFHWHPVHNTYQMALMTARSEALGLPPRRVLFFLCLGGDFLSFVYRGRGMWKSSTLLVLVASLIRRISFSRCGMLANPFSERCAFVPGSCRSTRIDSKAKRRAA